MTPDGAASFGQRVRRKDRLLGMLVRMPNEGMVELAGMVGLDYVVIDTEHGPGDQIALGHHLHAAAANNLCAVVRIGDLAEVQRALDLGAHGILAPHVSSVEQARALVAAAHYPPLGRRGFARYTRAGRYGLESTTDHHGRSRDTVVIAMIEDRAGLAGVAEIAALDGIDGLMLGPSDLASDLGVLEGLDDPRIATAASVVRQGARAAGVSAVSIVDSAADARHAFAAGDAMVMYNVQHALGELFTALAAGRPSERATGASGSSGAAGPAGRVPLVLLPGMLGDATVWDAVAAELVDVAAPRFGRIDLDDSIPEMAASVLAAAPARFALAGHSLGAIVALEVVRQAPRRVTRLALLNASGRGPSADQQVAWAQTIDRVEHGGFAAVAAELARLNLPEPRRRDEQLRRANERMAYAVGADALRRQLRAQQARVSYLEGLADIDVPVLVLSGRLDDICPPVRQDELIAHCPRARLVSLDAGHMSPLEQPAAVAAQLRTWLVGT